MNFNGLINTVSIRSLDVPYNIIIIRFVKLSNNSLCCNITNVLLLADLSVKMDTFKKSAFDKFITMKPTLLHYHKYAKHWYGKKNKKDVTVKFCSKIVPKLLHI